MLSILTLALRGLFVKFKRLQHLLLEVHAQSHPLSPDQNGQIARRFQKIQMVDIARMAGVSTSTVSRALNGSPLINQETRQRIADLARSLSYSINLSAKNLRSGDNRTIGVVIPYQDQIRQDVTDPSS